MGSAVSKASSCKPHDGSATLAGLANGYFASVTVRLPSVEPEAVLSALPSATRGFWQSGRRWVAHAGVAGGIDSRSRRLDRASPEVERDAGRSDRLPRSEDSSFGGLCAWVRGEAERLYGERWLVDLDGERRRPRLHGGFAFEEAQPERGSDEPGFWEDFPGGRFVLPAYEVEADSRGSCLTVTRRFPGRLPGDQAIDRLRGLASRAREEIAGAACQSSRLQRIPPAIAFDETTGQGSWERRVNEALGEIRSGNLRKVALARAVDLTLAEPPAPVILLSTLRGGNPLAHVYLAQFARGRFFVGASPEILGSLTGRRIAATARAGASPRRRGSGAPSEASKGGLRFRTMAVGGSAPRGADPESDAWLGHQLLNSRKNRTEHEIVIENIVGSLGRAGIRVGSVADATLLRLPRIQHLKTLLEAEVPARTHILSLVEVLHPTAAVCGEPSSAALDVIRAAEPLGRGWYAGPVGWFDASGDGEFAPALRCAVCRGPLLRLYAGAGIVAGSLADAEWDETQVKFQTTLGALGVAPAP